MKKQLLLVVAVICLLPFLSISQVIEWQNTIGGSSFDMLLSIQQTTDGGFILGGQSNSNISGDKTENSHGDYDYWIVKTDSSGNIEWQNTIGGSGRDLLFSVKQTFDGGYILGGWSASNISGDKTENCIGIWDYWIVKVNSSGVVQWDNTIGGTDLDELYSIDLTSDGGFILGGTSKSDISGDKTENAIGPIGAQDYWIVKTDSMGVIEWQNTIGGNGGEQLFSIRQTADDGFIMCGKSNSMISGDKTENSIDGSGAYMDYWVVKTDASGNVQWDNTIGGSFADYAWSVEQTIDGGYIVGGHSNSNNMTPDKSENSYGQEDYWIVKLDAAGSIQWENTIGGSMTDRLYTIHQTYDGGYIMAGESNSNISGEKTENSNGNSDYWVIKTDAQGILQWQKNIGGSGGDILYTIEDCGDFSFMLAGYSISPVSGDKTEACLGANDYWIVKVLENFNFIRGKLFIDSNSNNTQDTGEPDVSGQKIIEVNTGNFGFSANTGEYTVVVANSGNYSVSPVVLNYYNAVPAAQSASFSSLHETDSLNDFAFQPSGVYNDLVVTLTPVSPFRIGMNAYYNITYKNTGTTTLIPSVIFHLDNDISFLTSTPATNTVTPDSIIWNFGPIEPFHEGSILITTVVDSGISIGTLINSEAVVEPLSGDADILSNYSQWDVYATAGYDPNDIMVDEDTLYTTQFPNPPFLEYIIRFQNTGNDTAFTVNLQNPIDTNILHLNSFEFVNSSHPVTISWLNYKETMEFRFDNILLPDSNANEPESHGFVRYRIKPKSTLTAGDSITNYAAIYFDFNAPVITNTAVTHVVLPTSLYEISATSDQLVLYPNPANSTLTIETDLIPYSVSRLFISDVTGRTLFSNSITANSTKHNLDISSLSRGIYFVQLKTGERISRGKFVKD